MPEVITTDDQVVTMTIPIDAITGDSILELDKPLTTAPVIAESMSNDSSRDSSAGQEQKETQPIKPPQPEGHPCEFCADKEAILQKTREYIESGAGDKPKILFLNELAMKLGKHRETIMNWAKKTKDDELEHPEFFDMIKSVEEIQELRLQQRVLGRYNPTGAIFLLKTKHGYIETDKKILAGDKNEPIQIEIIEEESHVAKD